MSRWREVVARHSSPVIVELLGERGYTFWPNWSYHLLSPIGLFVEVKAGGRIVPQVVIQDVSE